nr:DNA cytosine methyltransferase [Bradyrhizobium yuanmingense]
MAAKIARLANGGAPRVIDLFAGCGGLSLGFHSAGFELVGAVENDPLAAATHSLNFFSHAKHSLQEHGPVDVTKTDPEELLRRVLAEKLSVAEAASRIDVLIGGPPCQAYSIVGRAKLREIAQHPLAFEKDLRAQLYKNFLHYVRVLKPLAVLIENVPEILRYGTRNVAEDIASELEALGYQVRYTILNAVHYGVPQLRDRMFMIAYINELELLPEFPAPTHRHALPKGYKNLRRDVTAKLSGLFGSRYFLPPVENTESGEAAVTARDAIGDLPPITKHLEGQLKRGARRFDEFTPYAGAPLTAYAKTMRGWPAFRSRDGIYDHVIRYLPRDYKIFARMAPGDEYPQAHALANRMFEEALEARSTKLRPSDPRYAVLKKEYVPPYDPAKFANKWRKIDAEEPVRTITAHIGKDSYSHIHYSSDQARTISVREAARLQSFPDGFKFAGTLDPALRQIGNSVPPLIARALARKMKRDLLAALRHARAR